MRIARIPALMFFLVLPFASWSDERAHLRIAVAANFSSTAEAIARDFEVQENVQVDIISGSSGKLATQMASGAPYDIFLSADRLMPEQLKQQKLAYQNKLFDYAVGIVVFIGKDANIKSDLKRQIDSCRTIAIANPEHAPYGKAAMQALKRLDASIEKSGRLVTGESVGQAMGFIESGAADCGFVALSQVIGKPDYEGRFVKSEPTMHEVLMQTGIILATSPQTGLAQKFFDTLLSEPSRSKIKEAGYELP